MPKSSRIFAKSAARFRPECDRGTSTISRSIETPVVMCWLWLGLKAQALTLLEAAWAWRNHKPGQKPKVGLGLACSP